MRICLVKERGKFGKYGGMGSFRDGTVLGTVIRELSEEGKIDPRQLHLDPSTTHLLRFKHEIRTPFTSDVSVILAVKVHPDLKTGVNEEDGEVGESKWFTLADMLEAEQHEAKAKAAKGEGKTYDTPYDRVRPDCKSLILQLMKKKVLARLLEDPTSPHALRDLQDLVPLLNACKRTKFVADDSNGTPFSEISVYL